MKASCDDPGVLDNMFPDINKSSRQKLPGQFRSRFGDDSRKIDVVGRQEESDDPMRAIDIGSSRSLGSFACQGLPSSSRLRRVQRRRIVVGDGGRWRKQRENGDLLGLCPSIRVRSPKPLFFLYTRHTPMEVVLQVQQYVPRKQLYKCQRKPG